MITMIYEIALGLERRFPNNNSPFAYGTRLCEEVGELTEALNDCLDGERSAEAKIDLVKEVKDVLQIVTGLLGKYGLLKEIPQDLSDYFAESKLTSSKDDIIKFVICAGQFADAINHKESQGIKHKKRGNEPNKRLIESAVATIACICQFVRDLDLQSDLKEIIEADYLKLKHDGFAF